MSHELVEMSAVHGPKSAFPIGHISGHVLSVKQIAAARTEMNIPRRNPCLFS